MKLPARRQIYRRRWLRPAAPFVVGALVFLIWTLATSGGSEDEDPATARPLARSLLAHEDGGGGVAAPSGESRRQLVDLVDEQAPDPRRILIPKLGVSAPVVPLRVGADGTMETPVRFDDAGWFRPGREPGEQGPAVVVGHVDSTSGPAIFYRLRELHRGDRIRVVRADGSTVSFWVEGLERWPKATFPSKRVFAPTRVSALRLVTCSGSFDSSTGHYADNTVVYAARMPVYRTVF